MSADRAKVEALARVALQKEFPEDLALFPVTAQAYFADPNRAVKAAKAEAKDEMLGFGVEMADAVPMVSTAALWVAHEVLTWVGSQVRASLEEESAGAVRRWVRTLLRLVGIKGDEPVAEQGPEQPADGVPLTAEQLAGVRDVALDRARQVLPEKEAQALSAAMVAALLPAPEK
jgi:hypothetical protein